MYRGCAIISRQYLWLRLNGRNIPKIIDYPACQLLPQPEHYPGEPVKFSALPGIPAAASSGPRYFEDGVVG